MKCILASYLDLYDKDEYGEVFLDNKRFIEDIVLPDTFDRIVYGINNGSYILIDDENYLYGEAYLLKNGKIEKISEENKVKIIK